LPQIVIKNREIAREKGLRRPWDGSAGADHLKWLRDREEEVEILTRLRRYAREKRIELDQLPEYVELAAKGFAYPADEVEAEDSLDIRDEDLSWHWVKENVWRDEFDDQMEDDYLANQAAEKKKLHEQRKKDLLEKRDAEKRKAERENAFISGKDFDEGAAKPETETDVKEAEPSVAAEEEVKVVKKKRFGAFLGARIANLKNLKNLRKQRTYAIDDADDDGSGENESGSDKEENGDKEEKSGGDKEGNGDKEENGDDNRQEEVQNNQKENDQARKHEEKESDDAVFIDAVEKINKNTEQISHGNGLSPPPSAPEADWSEEGNWPEEQKDADWDEGGTWPVDEGGQNLDDGEPANWAVHGQNDT
jgi:hypothetical protein